MVSLPLAYTHTYFYFVKFLSLKFPAARTKRTMSTVGPLFARGRPFVGCFWVGHAVEFVGVGDGRMFESKVWETFRDTFKAFVLYIRTWFEDG